MPDIRIKNKEGVYQEYTDIENIIVPDTEGNNQLYAQIPSTLTATENDIRLNKTSFGTTGTITGAIPDLNAVIYTPGVDAITIPAGQYINENQTILGDDNLLSENIVQGITIFGVEGTAKAGGVDPSDATATAGKILKNYTAYIADGSKAIGTIQTYAGEIYKE